MHPVPSLSSRFVASVPPLPPPHPHLHTHILLSHLGLSPPACLHFHSCDPPLLPPPGLAFHHPRKTREITSHHATSSPLELSWNSDLTSLCGSLRCFSPPAGGRWIPAPAWKAFFGAPLSFIPHLAPGMLGCLLYAPAPNFHTLVSLLMLFLQPRTRFPFAFTTEIIPFL